MKNYVLLGLLLLTAVNSNADCLKTAITQAEINACSTSKTQTSKQVLNKLVSQLENQLPQTPRTLFIDAQAAWTKMTAKDCAIKRWYVGEGSGASMTETLCIDNHNKQRIDQIRDFLCHPMKSTCRPAKAYDEFLGKGLKTANDSE